MEYRLYLNIYILIKKLYSIIIEMQWENEKIA